MRRGLPALLALLLLAQRPAPNVWQQIHDSTDVAWLESVAFVTEESPVVPPHATPKSLRSIAYARLGELGTPESLAAVGRIEATARRWRPNEPLITAGMLRYPGLHSGDAALRTDVRTQVGGVTYALFTGTWFGGMDVLLTWSSRPDDPRLWARPHLIPLKFNLGMRNLGLAPANQRGHLTVSYDQAALPNFMADVMKKRGESEPKLGPQAVDIDIDSVLRDTDHDGLTDVEEWRLGLRADKADTDGDGIPDGDDTAPDFAPPVSAASDENTIILQKAFFATFGISESPLTMFASTDTPRIQPWGSRGQVIYAVYPVEWGAVNVKWHIREKSSTAVTVELSDSEGPLSAGGVDVKLEKKNGTWYVVSVQTTWIS